MIAPLLKPDALAGKRLGLSASVSPDLARLGLTEKHLHIALAEMARVVLVAGGTLAWGGHLQLEGLTPMLIDEVRRYGRNNGRSLLVCLAWSEHRKSGAEEVKRARKAIGLYGEVICLDVDGNEIEPGALGSVTDPRDIARGLTAMRLSMRDRTDGRLMIGGNRAGFQGNRPGLVEEALITLAAGQPLYLAAGFGGATADIAQAASLDMAWLPTDPLAPAPDPKMIEGVEEVAATVAVHPLRTGLSENDLQTLLCTHRPSEIATLVSRGLGEVFRQEA